MSSDRLNAVVAGGSIGGLMSAIVLRSSPRVASVRLLERMPEAQFQDQGAGMGVRAAVHDFVNHFKPDHIPVKTFPAPEMVCLDKSGSIHGRMEMPSVATTSWTALMMALKETLSAEVKDGEARSPVHIEFGSKVIGITESQDGKVTVTYSLADNGEQQISGVDLVIGADGSNSTVRTLMGLQTERTYSGYSLYRTMVPLPAVPEDTVKLVTGQVAAVNGLDHTGLCMMTPRGVMAAVYHTTTQEDLPSILTAADGHRHTASLPMGRMRPEIHKETMAWCRELLAPQVVELFEKGSLPTVQVISDSLSEQNLFMNGKVLLIGEAVCTMRPQTIMGAGQTAYHALKLKDYLDGSIDVQRWARDTLEYSTVISKAGKEVGDYMITYEGESHMDKWNKNWQLLRDMTEKLTAIDEKS